MGDIGVAVIGGGWMGHVHARAYRRVREHWSGESLTPVVRVVAENSPTAAQDYATRHGVETVEDWHQVLDRSDVQAVSVTAPNFLHREIGVAVAEAGKHLWIEKPVGLSASDAIAVRDAVAASGVVGCVGFNYRQVPAVAWARDVITSGAIGDVSHARFQLFTDYAAHPGSPLSWRYAVEKGGHGVLGDLASHGIDLIRYLVGEIDSLVASTAIHIPRRPIVEASGHYSVVDPAGPDVAFGDVGNEDYVAAMLALTSGALAVLEASRAAVGEQNSYSLEVHGTKGLVRWDFRRPGELQVSAAGDYTGQPTSTLFSGPGAGEYLAFHPGSGIAMSYDDTKVVEAMQFLRAIAGGATEHPTLDDAVASAVALDAMVASHVSGKWVTLS